jgi:capsular polysaccharide biosynthesis protein
MNNRGEIVSEGYTVELAAPVNLNDVECAAIGFPERYQGPPVHLRHYEKVWLGKRSQIIDETGILPESFSPGEMPDRREASRVAKATERWKTDAAMLAGEKLLVSDWWSANYYHWMSDTLPRLEALLSGHSGGELLLPALVCDQPFVHESLAAYPQITIRRYDPDRQPVRVENLIVASHVAQNGFHHPVFTPNVFERLSCFFDARRKSKGRRIYVTRRHARMRRLANEEALLATLAAHGFEVVEFDGMTLRDQARLMGEVQIIAGPHGAGLTNMGFMAEGGVVFELRHLAGPSNCYISLASTLGHTHFLVPGEPPDESAHLHPADIAVAPERLAAALSEMEARLAEKGAAKEKGPAA